MPNPNFSVNQPPVQTPQPASPAPQAPAKTEKAKLKSPKDLFAQDNSQAKAPASGKAAGKVDLVETKPAKSAEVTQADIEWASGLEQKIAGGYQATGPETERYLGIINSLQEKQMAQAKAAGVPPEDMKWAAELEAKAAQGYQASAEEVSRYKGILNKLQGGAEAPAQQPAQQPAQTTQPAQQPAQPQPAQPSQQPANDASQAIGNLTPVAGDGAKPPADVAPLFAQLDKLLSEKKYMFVGPAAQPEQVRATAVQIWLDGKPEDRLKLSQTLVKAGQAELLGRIMAHQETTELDIARLMGSEGFPVKDYMNDLDDGPAFLVLNALAKVAVTGEPTSTKAIEQTVAGYDRAWDREAPFERLKAHLEAEGSWKKLPETLRHKIDELIK